MIIDRTEIQNIINATKTPWINFHNYHAAFQAIQKINDPTTHCYFKSVLVQVAVTGKPYDITTQQYL